jgi:hypothetical protein
MFENRKGLTVEEEEEEKEEEEEEVKRGKAAGH